MKKIYLDGEWNLHSSENEEYISAMVPGCVHSDLKRNGVIDDIYYRDNPDKIQWIEEKEWIYERDFTVEDTENAKIVFEGLDVYCDIIINGYFVAHCDDMFIEHCFDVSKILKSGENHITVKFYPPKQYVEGRRSLAAAFTNERLHTRRMQCTYGWDWVARFVTMGIFRSVYIMYDAAMRCKDAYVYTSHIDSYGAQIVAIAEFENFSEGEMTEFEVIAPDGSLVFGKRAYIDIEKYRLEISVKKPVLWDIRNDENQLYTLRITVNDEVFDEKFGIRTVRILQLPDEEGSEAYQLCKALQNTKSGKEYDKNVKYSSFEIDLNGRRVMCKGGNWVPCDPFPTEETDEKITKLLIMTKDAGMNIVRVWGGGRFEKEHFYNECDRLGIMVIQDFLMACGTYPEDEKWFIEKLRVEAEYASKKLRNHPSLLWWNGDNENAMHGSDEYSDYDGRRSAMYAAMPVIMKNDYMRNCLTSSPWGGTPNSSKTMGTTHNSNFIIDTFAYMDGDNDVDNYKEFFKEYSARFIAEEPVFGASPKRSLKKIMTDEDILEHDEMWIYHTKSNPCLNNEIFCSVDNFTRKLFGNYTDGEDRLFKLQYLEYEWTRITMENARRLRGFCGGIIYWMLNDCWPTASSWSLIDYYCIPKAGYYSVKKTASPVIVSIDKSDEKLYLYLCNDTDEDVTETVIVDKLDIESGSKTDTITIELTAMANQSVRKELDISLTDRDMLVAECGRQRTFYKNGGCKLEKCALPKIVSVDENSITLKADRYIHAVELIGECVFEDNYFSLKADEVRTVKFDVKTDDIEMKAYKIVED